MTARIVTATICRYDVGMPRSLVACSLALACGAPAEPSTAPATTPAQAAAPTPPDTPPTPVAPPPLPSTCTAPFVVPPLHPDTWIDEARTHPAHPLGPWGTRPMRGPSPDREALVPACTDVLRTSAPPFDAIVHCATGDPMRPPGPTNMPIHSLLVHTDRGWWVHELARSHWPHRREDEVQLARVTDVVAADRLGDGGAEITALTEVGPPGGFKHRDASICGLGPSGTPACASYRLAAGGPFHGDGAKGYALTVTCDGSFQLAGWEGGKQPKLIHAHATLAFP